MQSNIYTISKFMSLVLKASSLYRATLQDHRGHSNIPNSNITCNYLRAVTKTLPLSPLPTLKSCKKGYCEVSFQAKASSAKDPSLAFGEADLVDICLWHDSHMSGDWIQMLFLWIRYKSVRSLSPIWVTRLLGSSQVPETFSQQQCKTGSHLVQICGVHKALHRTSLFQPGKMHLVYIQLQVCQTG